MKLTAVVLAAIVAAVQSSDPQAIQRMVATERAFAASALEVGWRDAFLTYFADDAVTIQAGADGTKATVARARDGLQKLPLPTLPLAATLMWAPFTGHVSADGSFGWLTGGYANQDVLTKEIKGKGAYFSVWTHQTDGTWRVWLDEGISLPSVWQDASPFRAAPEPDSGAAGSPTETIEAAEKRVASGGVGWRAHLSHEVRLHRDGVMPIVGRDAAGEWAQRAWSSVRYTVVTTRRSGSDDLAVAIGGYDATPAQHGTWARVWKRAVTGHWRIVFETSKAVK
jgi:hypothetical protein